MQSKLLFNINLFMLDMIWKLENFTCLMQKNLILHLGILMATISDKTRKEYSLAKRFKLTTRKELQNICKDKKIRKNLFCVQMMQLLLILWFKKTQDDTKNPVLLHKPVGGKMDNYSTIGKRDFLLGIMNDAQRKT
ncbi:hypothetical protein TNIN_31711 [Trichonephila inaurata madagascariensis]|uniref:Uncharacterized protein n=1 Tax=Trichonephila inaurata madagascariensis TaxID=2747483 RepID=A0A8X7C3Y3_9ARAC|nr:hypothetical protein TNIN_31711 [Trichonephila inaurata madagascariensis]